MSKHNSNDNRYDTFLNVTNPNPNPNWKTSTVKKAFPKGKFTSTLLQLVPVGLVILGILYLVFK